MHEYKYTLGVNIRKPGQKSNSFGTCAQYKFGGSSMSDYCAIREAERIIADEFRHNPAAEIIATLYDGKRIVKNFGKQNTQNEAPVK